jgi:hypothetical protein
MSIALQADSTLPQGYILVEGQRAATVTTAGLSGLVNNAVTTSALASGAVTTEKIAPGAVITADLADGAVTPSKLSQPLTLATFKAFNWNGSTTNTFIDFENIPSWARRITVIFNQISTNGSSALLVQIGSGSIATSGYSSSGGTFNYSAGTAGTTSTAGFCIFNVATYAISGHMVLTLVFENTWISSHVIRSGESGSGGGVSPTLPGALSRIRLTTANGSDVFDAGAVNIMYEG